MPIFSAFGGLGGFPPTPPPKQPHSWTDVVASTPQPFWGWPFGHVPSGQSASSSDTVARDSQGNVDPNWAIPPESMNPYDVMRLAGLAVPGKSLVTCKKAQRVDKRHSPGYSGANATMLGFDAAEVDLEIHVWTEQQFIQLTAMFLYLTQLITAAQVQPRGTVQGAIECQHPKLSMLGIQKLYVRQLFPPDPSDTPGMMKARIRFDEFSPATRGSSATINAAPPPLNSVANVYSSTQSKVADPASAGGPGVLP